MGMDIGGHRGAQVLAQRGIPQHYGGMKTCVKKYWVLIHLIWPLQGLGDLEHADCGTSIAYRFMIFLFAFLCC
jgi:hypothetical protein